ncbi:uncharacterized protein BO97DRAFT_78648 [Aspergillus homomorphus CBS 101889]|uniref:Uncharacterized protein n=1 Tax=Aspergillus homomorphus (strain CBS 101889) TaxID=1450537 RepID=A0A395ICK6_ASPHC|nr:hypothetical protein BO97DRAFT_78648 [Aspergillus homomorphus CBS 101889]RAL16883.1 hypothetical protein BO97DRAFT_78648 [Aspergillus homomorphus CBS 101889]
MSSFRRASSFVGSSSRVTLVGKRAVPLSPIICQQQLFEACGLGRESGLVRHRIRRSTIRPPIYFVPEVERLISSSQITTQSIYLRTSDDGDSSADGGWQFSGRNNFLDRHDQGPRILAYGQISVWGVEGVGRAASEIMEMVQRALKEKGVAGGEAEGGRDGKDTSNNNIDNDHDDISMKARLAFTQWSLVSDV